MVSPKLGSSLLIFTDGGSRGNPGPAGIGVVVIDERTDLVIHQHSGVIGVTTNNEAEYQAFLNSLTWLIDRSPPPKSVEWRLDSKLAVEQLNRRWKVKDARMKKYVNQAHQKLEKLSFPYKINYVPREDNQQADSLVNLALDSAV